MRWRRAVVLASVALAAVPAAHVAIRAAAKIEPPPLNMPHMPALTVDPDGTRRLGAAYARHRGKVLEVRLVGNPVQIGLSHASLLGDEMRGNEATLYQQFEKHVPSQFLRTLIMDISQLKFRNVDQGFSHQRREEIAAQAAGFVPDPFSEVLPTFHRFVFLQSLYDIALSFERSPLLGCTSFALTDGAFAGGHAVLARNFDFEAGPVFDIGKAVFLVHEDSRIPYASVSWPGLVGVVTGMNQEGVALVVHGARASEPQTRGEPVVHTMRDVLGLARTTSEAIKLLEERTPMVSHMVMIADASSDIAIVERVPLGMPFVRRGRGKVALTNHLEGAFAGDVANQRVRATTSTLARQARLEELLANLQGGASIEDVVSILRDKRGPQGMELPLGDRRAIDALIATHAVVMDTTSRVLWVSEGPHLVGRFARFDLQRLFAGQADEPSVFLQEDSIASNGRYNEWVLAGSPHTAETR